MEKSGRAVSDRPAPFTQTKPPDAETIASQVPDKRAVQNKCKSYVKSIRRNASVVASRCSSQHDEDRSRSGEVAGRNPRIPC
jgi:hypothetical protein